MYIYTEFCVKSCSQVGDSNGLTLFCWGKQLIPAPSNHLDWHALMPAKCSKVVYRAGLYPSSRVMMAQGPLCGDTRSSQDINVRDEMVTQIIYVWASTLISCPQHYELAISRMKRGGVQFIIASHILQALVPLLQECQC